MFNFRKFLFKVYDFSIGGIINDYLIDINSIVTQPNSAESILKISQRKENILKHAFQNVPFYRNNCKKVNHLLLETFPVIDKNMIRNNLHDFIADSVKINQLKKVVTSGSTGTPFFVYQDKNKKYRNTADTIFFASEAGYILGTKLFYLKIWNKVNRKNKLLFWLENVTPVDVTQLSDAEISKLINQFKSKHNSKSILGYASALEVISRYLEKNEPNTKIKNIKSIIAMSEGISQNTMNSIYTFFGKYPISRYSNVENGIIAQRKSDGTLSFIINWASYFVEILEFENDNKVSLGKVGRIVITDFYNYSMPIIRYDTGDIGILDWDENKDKLVLKSVEGRKMDMVFNTSGTIVSSFTITNNMWLYPEIKQYQFIQKSQKHYLFKLNIDGVFEREELLISEFKIYFGNDAEISVEYVNEIPLLNSGKRKKVINLS